MDVIYETERLIVRRYTPDDAEQAFAIYSDAEVMRFLGSGGRGPVTSIEQMREVIADRYQARYRDTPQFGAWAAQSKLNGRIVGTILLKDLDGQPEIEVGWHLARFAWGQGFATEGGRGAITYGFERCGLDRIVAVVNSENHRSLAVCRRIGLQHEGKTTAYGVELEYFAITRG